MGLALALVAGAVLAFFAVAFALDRELPPPATGLVALVAFVVGAWSVLSLEHDEHASDEDDRVR